MRTFVLGALLALIPASAGAVCSCVCVEGEARSVCTQITDLAPLCQRVCLPNVTPLGSARAGGGGGGGSLGGVGGAETGTGPQGGGQMMR